MQLQQAVLAELKWEPSVNAAHIGKDKDSIVTLAGHVEALLKCTMPKKPHNAHPASKR